MAPAPRQGPIGGADLSVEQGLGAKQLVERDRLRLDAGGGARRREALEVVVRVVGRGDEIAAGRLDRARRDAPQHAFSWMQWRAEIGSDST